jgi:zinc and cadmium transporter
VPLWPAAIGLSVIGSVGGLLTASLLLLASHKTRARVVPALISYAVGTLLGAALFALLPEALDTLPPTRVFAWLLAGILTFFILEKLVLWRHSHEDDEPHELQQSAVTLIIVGDAVHTCVDGAVIAAAAMASLPLGVTTALAAAAHEIPQEAGDIAILLGAGKTRRAAFVLNATSAAGGVLGAVLMLAFGAAVPHLIPYVLAFAAGNFLYVAMADLIPSLHRGQVDRNAVRQVVLISLGVATIALL